MNVVDSSLWVEYFAKTNMGNIVAEVIEDTDRLIVPTVSIFKVYKKLLFEVSEEEAESYIMKMKMGKVIDLTEDISISAAVISIKHNLSAADSIVYATALYYNCILWTMEKHFAGLPSVNYFEKKK
jgi:predicted nucleic acid-binding protein